MSRALVIRGGALGDFLLTVPAINLLRSGLPEGSDIDLLGYDPMVTLARESGLVEDARPFEYAAWASFFVRPDRAQLSGELCSYLASYDLVLSYLYDPDQHFADNLKAAGVETLLSCPHRIDETSGDHAAVQLAKPLESIALYLDEPDPKLPLDLPPKAPRLRIALHPGSGSPKKNWAPENWAKVISKLPPHELFLITGEVEDEQGITNQIRPILPTHTHLSNLPLTDLAHQLASCHLLLGHDTGISHLAASVSTHSIPLFGPTNSKIWSPTSQSSPLKNLDTVSSQQVIEAISKAISEDLRFS